MYSPSVKYHRALFWHAVKGDGSCHLSYLRDIFDGFLNLFFNLVFINYFTLPCFLFFMLYIKAIIYNKFCSRNKLFIVKLERAKLTPFIKQVNKYLCQARIKLASCISFYFLNGLFFGKSLPIYPIFCHSIIGIC